MDEDFFQYQQAYYFMRYGPLSPYRPTLLFLHGIGDSGLSYLPFQAIKQFNLLIPDLLGYGKSSKNNDYSFQIQIIGLIKHIQSLEKKIGIDLNNIILIPHSMASIHAMLLCESIIKNKIKGIINVEGSITQYGSFISEEVAVAFNDGNFESWFIKFKEEIVFEKLIREFPACRPYYASLLFCHDKAFLQNALEISQYCVASPGKYTNLAGKKFFEINLPKVYCYGAKSLCRESIEFLNENKIPIKVFVTKNHFLMLDCFDEFVQFINNWISEKFDTI